MTNEVIHEASIPLTTERLTIEKRTVETGRVRIRTAIDERLTRVSEDLEQDDVTIERVPVNREITERPPTREENGVLIVPILEEVIVVEKRLLLKEELHVHRNRKRERVEEAVRLRSMRPEVERLPAAENGPEREPRTRERRLRRKRAILDEKK